MKTKSRLLFLLIAMSLVQFTVSQVPHGFNYQAVALNSSGDPITNQLLPVRITIQSDSLGGTIFWEEIHSGISTNAYGILNLIVGRGTRQSTSTLLSFSEIDWTTTPKFIKTEVNYNGWKTIGSARLWSVPYSMVAGDLGGPLKKLAVAGETSDMEEPLFEVRNKTGQTVFAVYSEGVRIYVEDGLTEKGVKGGFAIGGFGDAKAPSQSYFVVSPDSIRAYIGTNPVKGLKGGFAIGGLNPAKATPEEYLLVTRDSTRVSMANPAKGVKGGFAIGGFDNVKGDVLKFMDLSPDNYFIGHNSGSKITSGQYNSFIGYLSGSLTTTGNSNVFIGNKSGQVNTTGYSNVFIGDNVGISNITGFKNVFIGNESGLNNTKGTNNVYIGFQAGYSGELAHQNICIGNYSGYSNTSNQNLFIGEYAGEKNTFGTRNSFVGFFAGQNNLTGNQNSFFGQMAGLDNIQSNNTFIGYWSGGYNVNGANNVFLGCRSGVGNTGSNNVFLGYQAGEGNTGSGNILLGYQAGNSSGNKSNVLYIDNSNTSNPLIGGDFTGNRVGINRMPSSYTLEVGGTAYITGNSRFDSFIDVNVSGQAIKVAGNEALWSNGTYFSWGYGATYNYFQRPVTIGSSTSPSYTLNVAGTINSSGGYYNVSDLRRKKNLQPIENVLSQILKLEGYKFNWRKDEFPEMNFGPDFQLGFIAQEVEQFFPELVVTGSDGFKSLDYSKMTVLLLQAVKEQQHQIDTVNRENTQLKSELKELKENIDQIRSLISAAGQE